MSDRSIIITSEEEAWQLLERLLAGMEVEPGVRIEFVQWPVITLRFSGSAWHATLPARMLQPVLELQREIYRAHALIKHGNRNERLTKEEKSRLEILLRIEKGSSNLQALVDEVFSQLGRDVVATLGSTNLLITIISVALIFGGLLGWKYWLAHRHSVRELELDGESHARQSEERLRLSEERIKLSQEETRRLELLEQARAREPKLILIEEGMNENRRRLLASTHAGDEVEVAGVRLDSDEVARLVREPRRPPQAVRFDGIFRILQVDASRPDGFSLRVQNEDGAPFFPAFLHDENLSSDMRHILQSAEWERRRVRLQINARRTRDGISGAEVISCVEE